MSSNSIPILLCVYRRVEHTAAVIQSLRSIKPKVIFVSANAAKNANEHAYTKAVRGLVDLIDWECTIYKKFEEEHIAECSVSITNAINWFFSHVDYGIILEDDCVMSDSFYFLCSQLLPHYKDEASVFHISGTNLNFEHQKPPSLQLTNFALPCWGWATWKRSWEKYTPTMDNWISNIDLIKTKVVNYSFWESILQFNADNKIAWDLQWNIDIWLNGGVVIQPSYNLVTNIGFDNLATLTKNKYNNSANLPFKKSVFFDNFTLHKANDVVLEQKIIDFISNLSG